MVKKSSFTLEFKVSGMACPACEKKVSKALQKLAGVASVQASFVKGSVKVIAVREVLPEEVSAALEGAGYALATADQNSISSKIVALIVAAFVALYLVLKGTGTLAIFGNFPEPGESASLLALFFVGALTSFHCIAMCGGINLSQSVVAAKNGRSPVRSNLEYQGGRLVSYTLVGGIVGLVGSVFAFSPLLQGGLMAFAGALMLLVAFNLFGAFKILRKFQPRVPKALARKAAKFSRGKGSFTVGFLNGLMPCGPLQAMQIYALGTGSFLAGATSMCCFCAGTIPLAFIFGTAGGGLSKKFARFMPKVAAAAILVMGFVMLSNGLSLSGALAPKVQFSGMAAANSSKLPAVSSQENPETQVRVSEANSKVSEANSPKKPQSGVSSLAATVPSKLEASQLAEARKEQVQIVESSANSYSYDPIFVKKGVPVEWTIRVPKGDLNGCNRAIVIPEYGIKATLKEGENRLSFTPERAGTFTFTCWMGMIRSFITVVDAGT